jgi:Fe-S cluster biogenesis protein NfuA
MLQNGVTNVSKSERIRALLEQLSAYIEQFHGGSVDMVDYDGKVLKVRLGGACLGCPLQPSTLHGWVEGTVRQFFPEIERIEEVP